MGTEFDRRDRRGRRHVLAQNNAGAEGRQSERSPLTGMIWFVIARPAPLAVAIQLDCFVVPRLRDFSQ
jgi:hypothetical protein